MNEKELISEQINNIAYHLLKGCVEVELGEIRKEIKNQKAIEWVEEHFYHVISRFDEILPSSQNHWNYFYEENLTKLGLMHIEDKELIPAMVEYYKSKQPSKEEMENNKDWKEQLKEMGESDKK